MGGHEPTPREQFEKRHRQLLAPQAVAESASGGRRWEEAAHPYRTCLQRDRDRIVHCSAFRRLDFKTQVFVPHEDDHFRTRLTHTLEVAQVARTLARALRLNEDLVEAVALAHDMGHPPFGHAGEQALDELMADHGRFEHNRQSLRIVDYLEHPYPEFRGLNLTCVVRECLAKHESRYDTPICEEFDTSLLAPLEGQLVDLADEIAYTSADVEDGLAVGWIDTDQLAGLALWRQALARAEVEAPQARFIHKRIRACKAVLAAMADDVVETVTARMDQLNVDSPDAARRAGKRVVAFSDATADQVAALQTFLLTEVYLHPRSAAEDRLAHEMIRELFEAYVDDDRLLGDRYRRRIETDSLHRVVCDYIAGMTDRFCRQEHDRIFGTAPSA